MESFLHLAYENGEITMAEIDEISETLGALKADMGHVRKTLDTILEGQDKTNEKVIIQEQQIKASHKRIDKIEPKVTKHEALVNKGFGVMAVIATLMGFLGSLLMKVFL